MVIKIDVFVDEDVVTYVVAVHYIIIDDVTYGVVIIICCVALIFSEFLITDPEFLVVICSG